MREVFSTAQFEPGRRHAAWQEAICEVYLKVDVKSDPLREYDGFIREGRFGNITVTDTLLSQQQITRENRHVAQLDKDCYYIQLLQHGYMSVEQSGKSLLSNSAAAAVFCASEPYRLHVPTKVRAYYVEVPRETFVQRFSGGHVPLAATINASVGLGRIATEFCSSLVTNVDALSDSVRARIGEELIDVIALALEAGPEQVPFNDRAVQKARLNSVKAWIEEHLSDPTLTLEKVAKSNQISLRQLHYLFGLCGTTPSDWIWRRRVECSYELLAKDEGGLSVTDIAFRLGFSSSSHFSTLFRRSFGLRPSDVKRRGRLPDEGGEPT